MVIGMELPNDYKEIIHKLIELRKQGRFYALYVDDFVVRIRHNMWDQELERLTWE